MELGRFDEACPKLDESQRLDPGGGTRLNAALCRERQGRLATAWSQFKLARADAERDGRADRVEFAERHLANLEPRLARLLVRLGTAVDRGSTVLLDGASLGPATLGVALPVDPGRHELTLRVPGGASRGFVVDAREATTTALVLEPPPTSAADARSSRQRWGVLSASAGAAAVLTGGAFALLARSRQADADARCPAEACSSAQARAVDDNASAHRWARAADVAFALGAVGLGVGSYLVITGQPAGVPAGVARSSGLVSVSGSF